MTVFARHLLCKRAVWPVNLLGLLSFLQNSGSSGLVTIKFTQYIDRSGYLVVNGEYLVRLHSLKADTLSQASISMRTSRDSTTITEQIPLLH